MMNAESNAKSRERIVHMGGVVGDVASVRRQLALLGWASLASWGRAHGYQRVTVRNTIWRWGLRDDRTPHGGIARALMRDLRMTIQLGRRP